MAVCFEKPKKIHNRKDVFVHTFLDGLPADGVTAMVIEESSSIYCIRQSVALWWSYGDACTCRGGRVRLMRSLVAHTSAGV